MSASPSVDVADKIRKLGREILAAIPGSQAIYADQHETEPYADVKVVRDARYGPHERHRLDVFTPEEKAGPRPIFIFVHGGGFVGGDKRHPGSPYNDNVALWAARSGLVGVNITYRFAPDFVFPCGSEDLAAAVAWAREHAGEIGGDPERIFLLGTSAGAVHVANFVAHDQFRSDWRGVAGAIMLSGVYDLESLHADRMALSYFGEDAGRYAAMSPLPGLLASAIPQLYVLTEFDPKSFEQQGLALVSAWFERKGAWPDFIRLMGHNHLTSTLHLNTGDRVLGDQMLAFMARCQAPATSSAPAMAG